MVEKEYIEREAVQRLINKLDCEPEYQHTGETFYTGLMAVDGGIDDIPNADVVEVKHGYWHLLNNCANEGVYCSVCNKKVYKTNYANQKIKSPYCPNCGAKMDGRKNV